jgi:hypothetical protein
MLNKNINDEHLPLTGLEAGSPWFSSGEGSSPGLQTLSSYWVF